MNKFFKILFLSVLIVTAGCSCAKSASEPTEKPYLKLSVSQKIVSCKSGSFEVYINSNASWKVTSQAGWIHVNVEEGTGIILKTVSRRQWNAPALCAFQRKARFLQE